MLIGITLALHLIHNEANTVLHLLFVKVSILGDIALWHSMSREENVWRCLVIIIVFQSSYYKFCLGLDVFFLIEPRHDCNSLDALEFRVLTYCFIKNSQRGASSRDGVLRVKRHNNKVRYLISENFLDGRVGERSPVSHGDVGGSIKALFL